MKLNKRIIFGSTLILLSVISGITIFSFLQHMDGFPDLMVRFLAGILGLIGLHSAFSGGFLVGKALPIEETSLSTPFAPRFATPSILPALFGFLWGYFSTPWAYGSEIHHFSYWVPVVLWAGGGFLIGSKRVTEMKFTRKTILGGFLIVVSISLGIVFFSISPQLADLLGRPLVGILSLVSFFPAFSGGFLLGREFRLQMGGPLRLLGAALAVVGIFLALLAYSWSYFYHPWAWRGYDYEMYASVYWVSIMLLLGGSFLAGHNKGT